MTQGDVSTARGVLLPILERGIAFDADPERLADEVLAALGACVPYEKVAEVRLSLAEERYMRRQQLAYNGWVPQVHHATAQTNAAIDALLEPDA